MWWSRFLNLITNATDKCGFSNGLHRPMEPGCTVRSEIARSISSAKDMGRREENCVSLGNVAHMEFA